MNTCPCGNAILSCSFQKEHCSPILHRVRTCSPQMDAARLQRFPDWICLQQAPASDIRQVCLHGLARNHLHRRYGHAAHEVAAQRTKTSTHGPSRRTLKKMFSPSPQDVSLMKSTNGACLHGGIASARHWSKAWSGKAQYYRKFRWVPSDTTISLQAID